jgi:methionine synthase II (cobalamin-independent)
MEASSARADRPELAARLKPSTASSIRTKSARASMISIHPRVPTLDEMHDLIALARNQLDDAQIWINPDTGATGSAKSSV